MRQGPALAGTVLNYFLDQGLNKATILFPGVACFALAVVTGALTHIFNEQYLGRRKRMLDASHHDHAVGNAVVGFEHGSGNLEKRTVMGIVTKQSVAVLNLTAAQP